jgi:hypothetical protein
MSARPQHLDRSSRDFSQVRELLRALFAFAASLRVSKPEDDTAIAWEDGEETSRR